MLVFRHNLGPLDNNTYILVDQASGEAAIVDPTFDSRPLLEQIRVSGWRPRYVLNTHAHIDHVVENAFFVRSTGAELALHPLDLPLLNGIAAQAAWLGVDPPEVVSPTLDLSHGNEIRLGPSVLAVVHVPGHSPGHVAFRSGDFAVVGDVLFRGGIGRTDLPGGNHEELMASIERELLALPDDTIVYPGHGETTTVGDERRSNPFLLEN
jgi:glyoxylase-like metal-dependent hydrolase (beta-lactamase superfamily II)